MATIESYETSGGKRYQVRYRAPTRMVKGVEVGILSLSCFQYRSRRLRTAGEETEMYVLPHTPMGRRALWLLLPVLLYPLYWSVLLLIPDSWRALTIGVAIALIGLAVASLVTAGFAIFREKERSILVIVIASLTFLLVLTFAVGEAIGGH